MTPTKGAVAVAQPYQDVGLESAAVDVDILPALWRSRCDVDSLAVASRFLERAERATQPQDLANTARARLVVLGRYTLNVATGHTTRGIWATRPGVGACTAIKTAGYQGENEKKKTKIISTKTPPPREESNLLF
jgi:hypothetical protein